MPRRWDRPLRKTHIYLIGVILLGVAYQPLKTALPSGALLLVVAIIYLLAVSFIAERFGKEKNKKSNTDSE